MALQDIDARFLAFLAANRPHPLGHLAAHPFTAILDNSDDVQVDRKRGWDPGQSSLMRDSRVSA
jgi:hypothetical protein